MKKLAGTTLAVAACLASFLGGCASDQSNSTASVESSADRFSALRRLAEKPGSKNHDLMPPDPALLEIAPDSDAWQQASTLLPDLDPADFFSADEPESPAKAEAPTQSETVEAIMLYARARVLASEGDTSGAIGLLEKATTLDPASPEPWRALGNARRAARFENSAGVAYMKSASLGIAEPEALTLAGLHAASHDEPEQAVGFLLRAVRANPAHADPIVGFVASASLGESLLDLGYTRAGADAISAAAKLPRAARVPTNLGREAAELQRNKARLLTRAGDALATLGEYQAAADAYTLAGAIPGAAPVQERLVFALRKSGNDSAAALVLLDELAAGTPITPSVTKALASVAASISPRSAVADALASIDDLGSPTRRARLIRARADTLPDRKALALLERSISDNNALSTPAQRSLFLAGLARFEPGDTEKALRWIGRIVADQPALARTAASAIFDAPGLPAGIQRLAETAIDNAAVHLALKSEFALLLQSRESIIAVLNEYAQLGDNATAAALERRARLASAIGDWDSFQVTLAELEAIGDDSALVSSLRSAQRFGPALAAAQRLASAQASDPTADQLLELAALQSISADPQSTKNTLDFARETDPLDERVYSALVAFYGPNGPEPDPKAIAEIGREIRSRLPDSTLLRQMLVGELLRRRLSDEAASHVVPQFKTEPTSPEILGVMLNIWRARAASGETDETEFTLAESAAKAYPNNAGIVRLLVGGLMLQSKPDQALQLVDTFVEQTSNRSLESLREQIIRDGLSDPDRADQAALARLDVHPRSIRDSVQLASLNAARLAKSGPVDSSVAAILDALRAIPDESNLTGPQRGAALNALTRAAVEVDTARKQPNTESTATPEIGPMLSLLDWAIGRSIPLSPGIHELRLVLLADSDASDDALIQAAQTAIDTSVNTAPAFTRRAAGLLVERGSADRAFDWLAKSTLSDSELDPIAFQEWFRLVLIKGDTQRGREMIDRLHQSGKLSAAWRLVRPDIESWADRNDATPAEMAYILAVFVPDSDGTGEARRDYLRLARQYDPRHPWACNDLGYTMLESGGDLAEAERLIEIAYEALPDRANIVDSLGWVRYHRGTLEDSVDPETGAAIPGAVTLLRKAVELSDADDDGVVQDHLGDALYAAGKTDEAILAWRAAARLANQALSRLNASGQESGVRSDELADLAVRAIMKSNALRLEQKPAIEPQRGVKAQSDPQK